jgi:hypothetical protein
MSQIHKNISERRDVGVLYAIKGSKIRATVAEIWSIENRVVLGNLSVLPTFVINANVETVKLAALNRDLLPSES